MKTLLENIYRGFVKEEGEAAKQAKQMGLVSKGWGRWADPRTGKITHKTDGDRLVPVKPGEEEPEEKPTGGEEPTGDQPDLDQVAKDLKRAEKPKKPKKSAGSTRKIHDKTVTDWAFTSKKQIKKRAEESKARTQRAIDYLNNLKREYKLKVNKDTIFDVIHGMGMETHIIGDGDDQETLTTEELKELIQSKSAAGQVNSLASEALAVQGLQVALGHIKNGDTNVGEIADKVCDELDYNNRAPDGILSREWVNASCGQVYSTLKGLENSGFDLSDIEGVYWDTARGNKLAGTTGHGTSSDLFVKMNDGTVVGVSLKKDGQIIFANLGTQKYLDTVVGSLEQDDPARDILMPGGENLTDVVQRQTAETMAETFSDPKNRKQLNDAINKMCKGDSELGKYISSSENNRSEYCSAGAGLLNKLKRGDTNFSGTERTLLCRVTSNFDKGGDNRFDKMGVSGTCRGQDAKITEAMIEASKVSKPFKRKLTGAVVKGLHITGHLGMSRRPPPDTMISAFGTGEVIDKQRVYELFKLNENDIAEVEKLIESGDIDAVENYFSDRISVEAGPKGFIANLDVGDEDRITLGIIDNRAKGVGDKPNTLIEPSDELKKALGGSVGKTPRRFGQPQESAPPELRKLIRDIALWKLGKYGN